MKRSLIILLVFCIASSINAQTQNKSGKAKSKKPANYSASFTPIKINGQSNLKAAKVVNTPAIYQKIGTTALNRQLLKRNDTKIIFGNDSITPIFIERAISSRLKSSEIRTPQQQSLEFLESVKAEMKIANPSESFFISNSEDDEIGQRHIRMSQKYKGIKVYNSDFYLHFSNQKEILNGKYCIINRDINIIPKFSGENALNVALADLRKQTTVTNLTNQEKAFLDYTEPAIDTVIVEDRLSFTKYSLAYHISIRPNILEEWIYFIHATNGSIIRKYNNTNYDGPVTANATDLNGVQRSINTYLESGKYYLMNIAETMYNATKQEGVILTLDAKNTSTSDLTYSEITSNNNTWANPTAVSSQYNATQAYLYFKNTFNRNSINGQGGSIISFINVAEDDGSSMENAFWNGKAAFYGNGGPAFKPLAGALDVAAHELGHGVIGNSANLEYEGQSGAINEGFADIFGSMVDRNDWFIGEDVTKTAYIPSGRLRDMSNPHNGGASLSDNGWQPMHMKEIYNGTGDNGGVHTNSGICNYVYYLFATAVTKEKAEQVFYRALTKYLTRFSQFIDLRVAVIQATKDLYGDTSSEVEKAKTAFDTVGVYDEQKPASSQNYPVNPGQDYLLCYNTDVADANTLYRSSVTATNFTPFTTKVMKGKVSVVDDGSYADFVSNDDKIYSISLDPTKKTESIISDEAIWDNVAVSKDGKRLAAISIYIDTSIFVYDYNSAKWAKFQLYNPTTQENQKSGGVNYADAIEFDHTGEYLIYDSFNSLRSATGDSINYWDIGLIHVWDNALNKFADGEVMKLFGSLPDSVSIGNPVFSKNSPNVIAFDYYYEGSDEYAILGMNVETGDLGGIASNNIFGYPSFSKLDDKIAYSSINTSDEEVISVANLNPDKISVSGTPSDLIKDGKWPVYYATGARTLGFAPLANFSVSYKSGKAPLTVNFTDLSLNDPNSWAWTFESGTPGSSTAQNPTVTYNTPGTYSVTLKSTNKFGNNSITKTGYITITNTTGIKERENQLLVYPNPVKNFLYIKGASLPLGNLNISVYSIDGKLMKTNIDKDKLDMSSLKEGIYIVKIKTSSGEQQLKIVKE